jgi:nucleotidyltransferase/DNA polymerase involved in DNA repair
LEELAMTQPLHSHPRPHLVSGSAACCWIPHFALRCEATRRPEFASQPSALLAPDSTRRLWQVAPLARHAGVKPGMTVSQAIGLCPALKLCEADPVHYDEQFARVLAALARVSPVVEAPELGRAFVGMDGLHGVYGGSAAQVAVLGCAVRAVWPAPAPAAPPAPGGDSGPVESPLRLGWGHGKFVAWVAATRAQPGAAVIVPLGGERQFLATQPLAVLPLDLVTHRRLRQLGVKTLGQLAALPEDAIVAQFGHAGRQLWRLAAGQAVEPVVGRPTPQPISVALSFFSPVAAQEMLTLALDQLVGRALRDPRRSGWRVQVMRVRAELEHSASWLVEVTLKDPTADRARLMAPLRTRLEQAPPAGAVARLAVEFTAFVPGTAELQLFARDATAAARAGRRRALRSAVQEIQLRLKRSLLYHVIEVQPWSRLPERRYALIDFEP